MANPIPTKVWEAYRSGRMKPEHRTLVETAIANGDYEAPEGFQALSPSGPMPVPPSPPEVAGGEAQLQFTPTPAPGPQPPPASAYSPRQDVPTKYEQALAEGKPYPTMFDMPELNEASTLTLKARLGKAFRLEADDMRRLLKDAGIETHAFPNGMMVAKSKRDGKDYVWYPGLELSDIGHGLVGAGITAGGAALLASGLGAVAPGLAATLSGPASSLMGRMLQGAGSGLVNSALTEGGRAAVGLEPDPNQIAAGAFLGSGVPVVGGLAKTGTNLTRGMLPEKLGGNFAAQKAAVEGAEAVAAAERPALQNLVQGASGDITSQKRVAQLLEPDPRIAAATDVLGITDDMPLHMLSDQSKKEVRELTTQISRGESSALPLVKGATDESLNRSAGKILTGLEAAGASVDLADAVLTTSGIASKIHIGMDNAITAAYKAKGIAGKTPIVRAEPLFKYVEENIDHLENFPQIKKMMEQLTPRPMQRDPRGRFIAGTGYAPGWATLEKFHQEVGDGLRGTNPDWKSAKRGMLKNLYELLEQTREATAAKFMTPEEFKRMKLLVVAKKKYEQRLETLFGKKVEDALSEDLFTQVVPAIRRAAGSGNQTPAPQRLLTVIGAMQNLPEDVQQRTLLTGLTSIFRKGGANGQPLNWTEMANIFDRFDAQKRVKTIVWNKLGPEGRKIMDAASTVSKQVARVLDLRNRTGNTTIMKQQMQDADTFLNRFFYKLGERLPALGFLIGAHTGTGTFGLAGAGTAGSLIGVFAQKAFQGALTASDQAVQEFLTSPELPKLIVKAIDRVPVSQGFFQDITRTRWARRLAIAMKIPMPDFQKMLRDSLGGTAAAVGSRLPTAVAVKSTQESYPTQDEE